MFVACQDARKVLQAVTLRAVTIGGIFVASAPARMAADLTNVYRNLAIQFFHKLREKIALKQQTRSEQFDLADHPKIA